MCASYVQHIYYYLSTFHRKNNKFKLDIFVTSAVIVGPTDIALVKIAAFYSTCAQLLTVTLRYVTDHLNSYALLSGPYPRGVLGG